MRPARLVLAFSAFALLTAGCGSPEDASGAEPKPEASSSDVKVPEPDDSAPSPSSKASDAGGLCELLEFEPLTKATGQPFTVATAGGQDEVTSCVLQTTEGSYPDITLTKANTTTNAKTYREEIPPEGSEKVKDLEKAGYSAVRDKVTGGGPVVEVGWLTKKHMYSLRYTTASGTSSDEAGASVSGLVEVSRSIADKD